tara:strand:+ start:224 stop:478 length:255 start_codon:yes stop_codon:yes gene_type:complete
MKKKCFALVVQKDNSQEMEIIFTSQFKGPCVDESIKLYDQDGDKHSNAFIAKLSSNTLAYQTEWIDNFNAKRNQNIAWNKANGF